VATAVALAVVSLPLAAALPLGTSVVEEGIGRSQPAFVTAEAAVESRVGTLQIVPQPDGGILATIVRGSGVRLDVESTLNSTAGTVTAEQEELATLAGNLASQSGLDASADLAKFGIRFVLLLPPAEEPVGWGDTATITQAASDTLTRTTTSLDGNAALAPVGDTAFGRLWRSDAPTDAAVNGQIPADAGGVFGLVTGLIAVFVIGATVLLSVPTGAGREAVRQAHRDAIRRASRLSKPPKPTRVARPSKPARPKRVKRPVGRRAKGVGPGIEESATPTPAEPTSPAEPQAPAEPTSAAEPTAAADTSSPKDADHGN
jgi:hypothetical protein